MKKTSTTLAALIIATLTLAAGGDGLLWRISGNGLEKPSYMFGTFHIATMGFTESVAGFDQAWQECDNLYFEISSEEFKKTKSPLFVMNYALAPADSTLHKVFTPEQFHRMDSVITAHFPIPGLLESMNSFKPAMCSNTLDMLLAALADEDADLENPLDFALATLAVEQGKTVKGLETADFQSNLLLGSPISRQAEDFYEAVMDIDKGIEQINKMCFSYYAQDFDGLARLMFDPYYGFKPEEGERLIFSRNRAWAEILEKEMKQAPTFAIFGCGHLPGPDGMIELLRSKGYTVEPVGD